MIINDDVIASIDENLVDVNAGWLWADCSVYSPDYASELTQPISVEASTLYDLRFVSSASNIIIRTSNISNSRILWAGWVEFINDSVPNDPVKLDVSALNTSISTGCIRNNLPELIKSTDNFIVPSLEIAIYPTSNFRGIVENHTVTSAAFTIPRDGVSYYVVANYNSGFPFLQLTSDRSQINQSDKVALYVTWNVDGNIHAIGFDNKGEGLANKVDSMIINTEPYKRSLFGGLAISTDASKHIILTSAVVYAGTTPYDILAYNSTSDYVTYVYHTSGNWTYNRQTSGIVDNLYYDNGTNRVNLSNNKYACRWIYRSIGDDKEVFLVYGTNEYNTLLLAQAEQSPPIPGIVQSHCLLVGRYIIKQGSSEIYPESAFATVFTSSPISNHNDLSNIQGGSVALSQYYHLTQTNYSYISAVSADVQGQLNALKNTSQPGNWYISAGNGLVGGGYISATPTLSLKPITSQGIYTKVNVDTYGRVTTGTTLTSGDIPQLPATKIGSGNISNNEFEYLDTVSANIQTQLNGKANSTSLTSGRIVTVGASGQLVDDAGLIRAQYQGVTKNISIGDGVVQDYVGILLNAAPGYDASVTLRENSISRWDIYKDASQNLVARAITSGGVEIDKPFLIPNDAGGNITLGGYGTLRRPVYCTNNISAAGYLNSVQLVASRAAYVDANKNVRSSNVTDTELEYLDGVSANIQIQLNGKLGGTGSINTVPKYVAGNTLGNSKILETSDTSYVQLNTFNRFGPNIDSASYTPADGEYNLVGWNRSSGNRRFSLVSVVTSAQSALGGFDFYHRAGTVETNLLKLTSTSTVFYTDVYFSKLTPSTVPVLDSNKILVSSNITSTELNYLDTVSANIQTQLNGKQSSIAITQNQLAVGGTNTVSGSGKLTFDGTTFGIGVSSNITNPYLHMKQDPGQAGGAQIYLGAAGTTSDENSGKYIFPGGRLIGLTNNQIKIQRYNKITSGYDTVWGIENTNTTNKDVTFYGAVSAYGNTYADKFYATSNGTGENVKIGDDLWIGDINIANTAQLKGVTDSTKAFLKFGTSGPTVGYDGSVFSIASTNNTKLAVGNGTNDGELLLKTGTVGTITFNSAGDTWKIIGSTGRLAIEAYDAYNQGTYVDTPISIGNNSTQSIDITRNVNLPTARMGVFTIPSYDYTLEMGKYYYVIPRSQSTTATGTIYLPASPTAGTSYMIMGTNGGSTGSPNTCNINGNGKSIIITTNNTISQSHATTSTLQLLMNMIFVYDGTYWYVFKSVLG